MSLRSPKTPLEKRVPATSNVSKSRSLTKCHCMCFLLWASLSESGLGAPDPTPFVGEFGVFLALLGKGHHQHGVHPGEEPSACFPLELGNRPEGG